MGGQGIGAVTARISGILYAAALFTLPWIGMGVLRLLSGRDWGGGLQPSWLLLALAMAAGVTVLKTAYVPRRWKLATGAVLAAVIISAAGLWIAPGTGTIDRALAKFFKQLIQFGIMGAFVLWPALWTRGEERWRRTFAVLSAGALFQIAYGLLQFVEYYHPSGLLAVLERIFTSNPAILSGSGELYLGDSFRNVPRLRGTACEPLYLGNYLLLVTPLAMNSWGRPGRRVAVVGLLCLLLLLTWSRGAWLGFLLQVPVAMVLLWRLQRRRNGWDWREATRRRSVRFTLWSLLAAVFVTAVGWGLGWDGLLFPVRRFLQTFSGQDWSNLTRIYSMQAAWKAFLLSPVVGIGWGQFGWHFPVLVDPMGLQSQFTWPVVNNFYLQVLCETGLVGFLAMTVLGLGLLRGVWRRLGGADGASRWQKQTLVWTTVGFVGVWVQMVSFSQYNLPHIWVALGLLLAATAEWDASGRGRSGE
jgi:O-antigen ligase